MVLIIMNIYNTIIQTLGRFWQYLVDDPCCFSLQDRLLQKDCSDSFQDPLDAVFTKRPKLRTQGHAVNQELRILYIYINIYIYL